MFIKRTASAGILLKLDGASILLDGVCREVQPYPATPLWVKRELEEQLPDAVCYTHAHKDHYDPSFARYYTQQTGSAIVAPASLGGCNTAQINDVKITAVPSRHIGKVGMDIDHVSFVIEGTKCVWFMGDSAPLQWRGRTDLPQPDVLLIPYAYLLSEPTWAFTRSMGAKIVLLHMPTRDNDPIGLWSAVSEVVGTALENELIHLDMEESIEI